MNLKAWITTATLALFAFSFQALKAQPGCIGFNADFEFEKDSASTVPAKYIFTNTSLWTDSTTHYSWKTNDFAFSQTENTDYTYNMQGTNKVCLFAFNLKPNGDTTCRDSACKQVTVQFDTCLLPPANLLFSPYKPDSCFFEYNFTTNTAGQHLSYLWTFGDGDTSINRDVSHTYATKGTYTVCIYTYYDYSNNRRCIDSACNTIEVCPALGIDNATLATNSFEVYPNPATDKLYIKTADANTATLTLSDVSGRVLLNNAFTNETLLDIGHLNSGFYFITIATNGTTAYRQKVVKE